MGLTCRVPGSTCRLEKPKNVGSACSCPGGAQGKVEP
jgi:hypothetical protein